MNFFSNFFNIKHKHNPSKISLDNQTTDISIIQQYKNEIKDIKIENQPFRLSGLLHILTNKVASLLQENNQTIYYDIEREIGRYIVGDNDYIEQILTVLLQHAILLSKNDEVVLKVIKNNDGFLYFEVMNANAHMDEYTYKVYRNTSQIVSNQSESLNTFVKVKMIANAMNGTVEIRSSKKIGTLCTLKIPYYQDKDDRSHKEELRKILADKKALFVSKNEYDTKRTQYIFATYGIHIYAIKLNEFETKKPNLSAYNMAITKSEDLSYKHISFFKNILQNDENNFKIIILHELFESEEKIKLSKPIADAELYSPTIIGDVEEILYQIFILQSKAVRGINNMEIFNAEAFTIKGNDAYADDDLSYYKGANIAIVEDSKADGKILQNILKQEGITLFCMRNGSEMIELLEHEEIDIIFTDINMPIMDGILMTKKIRTMKKWKKIPIISISSMAFPHELKKMELAGMNAAIAKPIEAKDVHMALKNFLIMTEKIRMRKKNKSQINFAFNKKVLDTSKGVTQSTSNLEYFENLLKTIEYLKNSRESFENMIYEEEFTALGQYIRSALSMYEEICAPEMVKMFKDLTYFISQRQRTHLVDYISIYKKNWEVLEVEVEKYISNM